MFDFSNIAICPMCHGPEAVDGVMTCKKCGKEGKTKRDCGCDPRGFIVMIDDFYFTENGLQCGECKNV